MHAKTFLWSRSYLAETQLNLRSRLLKRTEWGVCAHACKKVYNEQVFFGANVLWWSHFCGTFVIIMYNLICTKSWCQLFISFCTFSHIKDIFINVLCLVLLSSLEYLENHLISDQGQRLANNQKVAGLIPCTDRRVHSSCGLTTGEWLRLHLTFLGRYPWARHWTQNCFRIAALQVTLRKWIAFVIWQCV